MEVPAVERHFIPLRGYAWRLTLSCLLIVNARHWKVDRVTANHSLSSTASQGTSNIPIPCFLVLGCNRQAQDINH